MTSQNCSNFFKKNMAYLMTVCTKSYNKDVKTERSSIENNDLVHGFETGKRL